MSPLNPGVPIFERGSRGPELASHRENIRKLVHGSWFRVKVTRSPASGNPGGQPTHADIAIEAALTIRMVFHLPLLQTEGFLRCLAELLEVDLPTPDHTTLSRRLKGAR